MHQKGSCKCLNCGEFFIPDVRNRSRQRHCVKPVCQQASKAASQARWRAKPGNADYFKGPAHSERVRAWRAAHPGYAQRSRRRGTVVLQESLITQETDNELDVAQDAAPLQVALQDALITQDPLLVGLVAHLTGMTLQEDIAEVTRRLHTRGQAVLGILVPRLTHAYHDSKTNDHANAPPTGAAFV